MLFDAHLDAAALSSRDLEDLRYFGVRGALAPASDAVSPVTAEAIRRYWEALSGPAVRRLRRAGLAGYAALGIHPRRIPRRGLEALLGELPDFLGQPGVVAIGAIGLETGGAQEEHVFARQLELARELRLPIVVHTPWKEKGRITRRVLAILREAELDPARVLVDHADPRTVRMIRACGFTAGVSLSAAGGERGAVEQAVRLVRSLGAEGLVLASDAGGGGGDLLALPRVADRLEKAGLSVAVIRRVCGGNAVSLLGVEPRLMGAANIPSPSGRGLG